jgi:hypothetical protein
MPMLALTGKTRRWEPKKLRLRLFQAAAQEGNDAAPERACACATGEQDG